jgi:uncharacterized membrane protein YqjE
MEQDTSYNDKGPKPNGKPDNMISNLMGYIDTRIDLVKLEIQQKLKSGFVGLLHVLMLAFFGFMFFIFLNLFLALWLNDVMDSRFWGFGIITAVYLVLTLIFVFGVDKKIFQGLADKTFDNTIYKSDKRAEQI